MTTVTIEAPTPISVLNNKKRFAQVLDARDDARPWFDKIKSAPRAAREGLMSIFRALHVDALAGSLAATAARLWNAGLQRWSWLQEFIGRTLGWRLMTVYAVTDADSRNRLGRWAGIGYLGAMTVLSKTAAVLGKIPLIGKPLQAAIDAPLGWVDGFVVRSAEIVVGQIRRFEDHWTVRTAAAGARGLLFLRLVQAFVPSPFRFGFYLAYLFRPAQSLLTKVKDDEATAKVTKIAGRVRDSARAAAAEATDVVVDRVLDGPDTPRVMYTTQPGTEIMDVIVVSTGKRETVTVDIDSRGQKWITWDGVTYSAEQIGEGELDPIRPLPMDLVTKAMKADEAAKAAAAAADSPMPRAVSRATSSRGGSSAKAKTGSRRH